MNESKHVTILAPVEVNTDTRGTHEQLLAETLREGSTNNTAELPARKWDFRNLLSVTINQIDDMVNTGRREMRQ